MSDYEEALAILRKIEQNQTRALEMQAEQLALTKARLEQTEVKVQESIALQRLAVARQARATNIALPIIIVMLIYLGYKLFPHL